MKGNFLPFSPQHNGLAKKKIRDLMDKYRALIEQAHLPKNIWGFAAMTIVHLINKLLTYHFRVVKSQRRRSKKKIYKTELTKIRYKNQVLCKYQVDPQRAGLTLIAELTWSNLGLKEVLNKRK